MAKGVSLHIGLNTVDPDHYAGWAGPLIACEADARDMQLIATAQGFESRILLTPSATRRAVLEHIAAAAQAVKAGDIFMLTLSAHGSQVPDLNGDERDRHDETWCLYDGQLIDDELSLALGAFAKGVRIIVTSDSCHSGTVVRTAQMRAFYGDLLSVQARAAELPVKLTADRETAAAAPLPRVVPMELMSRIYLAQKDIYDAILRNPDLSEAKNRVAASVILLSGCQDNQTSMDGPFNGAFTGELKHVWSGGTYKSGHDRFIADIRSGLNDPLQSPGIYRIGEPNPAFDAQAPFRIN